MSKFLQSLLNNFIMKNGRQPNAVEMMQLRFRASQGTGDVIQFQPKRNFAQEVEDMIKDGTIKVGEVDKKNKKVLEREIFQNSNLNKKPIDELQNYTKTPEEIVQDLVDRKFGKNYFDPVEETEEQIKKRLMDQNKKGIASMKKKLEEPEEKADGGRIGYKVGKFVMDKAVSLLLKDKKKIQQAVDDIYPTGDYKYDAEMAADALVENNPEVFKNLLREDLPDEVSSEIYGAVLNPISNNLAKQIEIRRLTKPTKTLQSMKEGKGINMSDPEIADEFTTFMKEKDPKGFKEMEQKLELSNFKTKDRKENADGGRIGLKNGMTKRGFLKLMGGAGALTAAAKTGLLKFAGKEPSKEVAKEVVKSAGSPPPYFLNLVKKIKTLGDDVTDRAATQEREIVTDYKDYRLTEDLTTGRQVIQKTKLDTNEQYYDETLAEQTYMDYTPGKGQADEATGPVSDEYIEDTSYLRTSGPQKGEVLDVVDGVPEDVIQEGTMFEDNMTDFGKAPSIKIKKASGGIARMLGE